MTPAGCGLVLRLDAGGGAHALRSRRGAESEAQRMETRDGGWPRFVSLCLYVYAEHSEFRGRRTPDRSGRRRHHPTNGHRDPCRCACKGRARLVSALPAVPTTPFVGAFGRRLHRAHATLRGGANPVHVSVTLCSVRAMALPPERDPSAVSLRPPCGPSLADRQLALTFGCGVEMRSPGSLTAYPTQSSRPFLGEAGRDRRVETLRWSQGRRARTSVRNAEPLLARRRRLRPAPDATEAVAGIRARVCTQGEGRTGAGSGGGCSAPAGSCVTSFVAAPPSCTP